ncbi:ABC transporter permease [Mycobacterium tilburgii]|uniref:ABC transporter permease n=1 Tax=Mycobacterium tilburgii TaxID=44467 RepID=UPI0011845F99|nr:ABC transporter permease [Mycobacterium tilburgii]
MKQQVGSQGALLTQSWIQASRLLIRWRRDRAVLLGSLAFPICLMLIYQIVLGERVRKVTGIDSVYGLAPLCAQMSALFGTLGAAVDLSLERELGLLSRMWVLPVHRASALAGRMAADAARALVATTLVTAVGVAMGLRFTHGWYTVLFYILIPSVAVVGFTAFVMALAISTNGRTVMVWLVGATISLAFLNPGTTPIALYPDWLQPFVRVQPVSPPIETMWALAHGGPFLGPLAITLLWTVGLLAVFVPIAARGYRIAAERTT